MEELAGSVDVIITAVTNGAHFAFMLLAILWIVQLCNWLLKYRLNIFGILPRHPFGLIGIFTSPFLHGDFNHLFFNSIPLFVLTCLIMAHGAQVFYYVSGVTALTSGLAIWLFGRKALHIGASGMIMGFFGYLLADAYFQYTPITVILAALCLYYFGGLIVALIPSGKPGISWEGHVFGFLGGILAAYTISLFKYHV